MFTEENILEWLRYFGHIFEDIRDSLECISINTEYLRGIEDRFHDLSVSMDSMIDVNVHYEEE